MTHMFVFTAGNRIARKHLEDSIERSVRHVARGHVFSPPAGFLERPTLFVGRRAYVA